MNGLRLANQRQLCNRLTKTKPGRRAPSGAENGRAMKKLIIVGAGAFAEVACEYFTDDSDYDVVGFAAERAHIAESTFCDLPVHALEDIVEQCPPGEHSFFVAITYNELNRLRRRLYDAMVAKGFAPASYVSSRAFVARSAQIGAHCFVMEGNVIQPRVTIGENVVLWSGNHVGHHSTVQDNCFISSHVVISGFCDIGKSTFIGVNATLTNNISIGADCWIGPTCNIIASTQPDEVYRAEKALPAKITAKRFFKVKD